MFAAHVGLVTVVAALAASGGVWAKAEAPSALRAPSSFVTDQVGFLSPAVRERLDRRLAAVAQGTGHQVIVWIGRTTGGQPLEEWSARTFAAWQVGRKGLDDGVALFILADERRVRIEVGYGLEDKLPDVVAARIIREEMVPRIQQRDRDGAVLAAADRILAAIGVAGTPADRQARPAVRGPLGIAGLVFIGLLLLVLLALVKTHPALALYGLFTLASGGHGRGWGGGIGRGFGRGGFSGGGGRSGGGGASGSW